MKRERRYTFFVASYFCISSLLVASDVSKSQSSLRESFSPEKINEIMGIYKDQAPYVAAALLRDIYTLKYPNKTIRELDVALMHTGLEYADQGQGTTPFEVDVHGNDKLVIQKLKRLSLKDLQRFEAENNKRLKRCEQFIKNTKNSTADEQKLMKKYGSWRIAYLSLNADWEDSFSDIFSTNKEAARAAALFERINGERRKKVLALLQKMLFPQSVKSKQ